VKFVLDASLTLAWCFRDEKTTFTELVLLALPAAGAAVPSIWVHEVANGLRTAQKSQRIGEPAVSAFIASLGLLPVETIVQPPHVTLVDVRRLALAHNVSAYDAAYVVLAQGLGLPLATLDGTGKRMGLKQAAEAMGVPLVSESMVALW
jgi:predicted nucleic acid-binding protein